MPIILWDTSEKKNVPEEEVEDLGDYYFNKIHQEVLRKSTNKWKVVETS